MRLTTLSRQPLVLTFFVLLLVSTLLMSASIAQQESPEPSASPESGNGVESGNRLERLEQALEEAESEMDSLGTRNPVEEESVREARARAYQALYEQLAREYEHRGDTLRWQLRSASIIFGVVVALVVAGIIFAGLQFYLAWRGGDTPEATEMQISREGLQVSSSVLGIVILVISLAFFYLYLVYVYPIQEI